MSVYHPTAEEIFASMGVPMEGLFDGAEAVLATPAPPAAHKAPAKTPTPSAEPVPRDGTHVEGVGKTTPLPTERFTPSKGVIPSAVVQTKITSPILPLVISSSDPFADISQLRRVVLRLLLLLPPSLALPPMALIWTYLQKGLLTFLRILMMYPC